MTKYKMKKTNYILVIKYLIFGSLITIVGLIAFWIFINIFGFETNFSNTLSILCSVCFAYIVNKMFVFKSNTNDIKALICEMGRFFSSRILTMIISISGVFFLHNVLFLESMMSKIIVTAVVTIFNFFFSKFFVFSI